MQSTKQAIFRLGNEEYGLDILDVNIIENFITATKVSDSPSNIKGIIRLRGDIIPVYSLRAKFHLEDKLPDEETRLILTTSNGILMAYEVDMIEEIIHMDSPELYEVPSIIQSKDTSYMKLVSNIGGRIIVLLDSEGILSEEEQDKIKTMIQKIKADDQKIAKQKEDQKKDDQKKAKQKKEEVLV